MKDGIDVRSDSCVQCFLGCVYGNGQGRGVFSVIRWCLVGTKERRKVGSLWKSLFGPAVKPIKSFKRGRTAYTVIFLIGTPRREDVNRDEIMAYGTRWKLVMPVAGRKKRF